MENRILYTNNLSVGYDRNILIENINISVKSGEILTLIGSNGSGKSTVLKSISGQLDSICGKIFIDGKDIRRIKKRSLSENISIMMTDRIYPELMSCREIVEYGRYPYTGQSGRLSKEDKLKVSEAMKLMNIEDIAEKDFNFISDGQKQRVMLARAVCQEPDILILDEPTSFLDIRYKLELLDILKNLAREKNIAVIMSLHELELAQKISDFVICIKGNKIDRCGSPEEIFCGDYISMLYNITSGSYKNCIPELEPPHGNPQIFVIAGNGKGTDIFRRLQRKNIAFAAGIIHENDIDYPTASALASIVVTEKPFEPIGEAAFLKAKNIIDSCRKAVCCLENFGTMNQPCRKLMEYAEQKNFLICKI